MKTARNRYVPKWHSLAGCVAAWQPVRAPDALHARWNVGRHMARVGQYDAIKNGTSPLPVWSAVLGWTGSLTASLATGIVPNSSFSAIARFSGADGVGASNAGVAALGVVGADCNFGLVPRRGTAGDDHYYYSGQVMITGVRLVSGVMAVSGQRGYLDGVDEGAIDPWAAAQTNSIYLLALNSAGTAVSEGIINLLAAAIYDRPLTVSEVLLATRQLQYCDVNPDWNAWARQRQYWYAAEYVPPAYVPRHGFILHNDPGMV